jgi:hypothetical protein
MSVILSTSTCLVSAFVSLCAVSEPVVEEVVETEAITLATADGQIVRVISKEQYDRWGQRGQYLLFSVVFTPLPPQPPRQCLAPACHLSTLN